MVSEYGYLSQMRRLLAITVIAALICAMGMPVWASETSHKAMLCHREPAHNHATRKAAHHCNSMAMEDEQDATAASDSETFMKGSSHACPVQCCTQANAGTSPAVVSAAPICGLHSAEDHVHAPAVTFSTPGFSSHTDRGPPQPDFTSR